MRVTVVFYPPVKKIIGEKEVAVTITDDCKKISMQILLQKLINTYPQLEKYLFNNSNTEKVYRNVAIIKNNNTMTLNSIIEDGDVIKLFSPLSGG